MDSDLGSPSGGGGAAGRCQSSQVLWEKRGEHRLLPVPVAVHKPVSSLVPFQGSDFRVQSASSRGTAERAREARLPALASLRAWLLGGPCHRPRTAAALSPCGAGTGSSFAGLAGLCVLPAGGSFRTTCSTSILHLHVGGDNPSPGRAWLWCSSPLVGRGSQDTQLMSRGPLLPQHRTGPPTAFCSGTTSRSVHDQRACGV